MKLKLYQELVVKGAKMENIRTKLNSLKKNRAVWIGGSIGGIYATIFVSMLFYYKDLILLLDMPVFAPIYVSTIIIGGIFWFLGFAGDGASFAKTFLAEGIILPILTIAIWTIIGMIIGWLIKILNKK